MKNDARIDPFDTDLCFDYDVRELSDMTKEEAEYLLAQLTVARLQTTQHLRNKEENKQEFVLDAPF